MSIAMFLADPASWPGEASPYAWVEEVICEAASLYALRNMATRWATDPVDHWRAYSSELAIYEANRSALEEHCLPEGTTFAAWLADAIPLLEINPYRREDNTLIAKQLLPILESEPSAWRVVRHLHEWRWQEANSLEDFAYR